MKKALFIATITLIGMSSCIGKKQPSVQEAVQEIQGQAQELQDQVQQQLPENPPEGSIDARFTATDNVTKQVGTIDVSFYPALERATLRMDGKSYDLKQYPTASGFGYKNDEMDLRGKGEEATLEFTDSKRNTLSLKQITDVK
jgi:membrane-bound inhibitor of C-type lysozyme